VEALESGTFEALQAYAANLSERNISSAQRLCGKSPSRTGANRFLPIADEPRSLTPDDVRHPVAAP